MVDEQNLFEVECTCNYILSQHLATSTLQNYFILLILQTLGSLFFGFMEILLMTALRDKTILIGCHGKRKQNFMIKPVLQRGCHAKE